MRKECIKTAIAFLILSTFLWTQFLWAYGIPLQNEVPSKPEEPVKNLPINIQEQFPKDSCKTSKIAQILTKNNPEKTSPEILEKNLFSSVKERTGDILRVAFLANPTPQIPPQFYPSCSAFDRLGRVSQKQGTIDGESYKVTYNEYDSLGRPLRWTEKQGDAKIQHSGIVYDEIGRIISEYIEVKVSKGSGIFKSSSKTKTYYEYSYDIHGNRETTLEDEIYSKTFSNPIGKIVKAVVSIGLAIISGPQWLALNFIESAILIAVTNFAFNVMSGAEIGEALIGAVISAGASILGAQLGGADLTAVVPGFSGMSAFFEGLSLIDSLMVDDQGRELFEQVFGKWGNLVFNVISVGTSLMSGGLGINGPPNYELYANIGRLIISAALTAAGDSIHPYLRMFISNFTTSFLNAWANSATQQIKENELRAQGYEKMNNGNWTKVNEDGTERETITKNGNYYKDIYDEQGNYIQTEVPLKHGLTAVTNIFGTAEYYRLSTAEGTTYLDTSFVPIFTELKNGNLEIYNIFGQKEGIAVKDTEIRWNEDGTFKDSYKEFDTYTEYYDKNGDLNGRILDGYTAIEQGDQIIGQYKDISEDTYIYRDADGRFVNKITITESGGILQNDGTYTTYFNNSNIREWARENFEHSDIYFFDPSGKMITEVMSTSLDESGLVTGYTFTDLVTGNITKYDSNGEYQGYYEARTNSEGEIIGYKGTDKDGNYIVLDRRQDILLRIDNKDIATIYDIDPSKPYLVLTPDAVHVIGQGDNIRFVLGQDPETGKYTLYDPMGTFVTDNPLLITAKLNFSMLNNDFPGEIRENIVNDAVDLLKAVKLSYLLSQDPNVPDQTLMQGLGKTLLNGIDTLIQMGEVIPFSVAMAYASDNKLSKREITNLEESLTRAWGAGLGEAHIGAGGQYLETQIFDDEYIYKNFSNSRYVRLKTEQLFDSIEKKGIMGDIKVIKDMLSDVATAPISFIPGGNIGVTIAKECLKIALKCAIKGDFDSVAKSYIIGKIQGKVLEKVFGKMDKFTDQILDESVNQIKGHISDKIFSDFKAEFGDIQVYEVSQFESKRKIFAWPPFHKEVKDHGYGAVYLYNTNTNKIMAISYKIFENNEIIAFASVGNVSYGYYGRTIRADDWSDPVIFYEQDVYDYLDSQFMSNQDINLMDSYEREGIKVIK